MRQKKKKGWVRKTFSKAASIAILPLSIKHGYSIFFSLLAVNFALHFLNPTAEELLEENNIDPMVASQLSDRNIHVSKRETITGQIHSNSFAPILLSTLWRQSIASRNSTNSFATRGALDFYNLFNQCSVNMRALDFTVQESTSLATGIAVDQLEAKNWNVSNKDLYISTLFHEFRHCHRDNDLDEPLQEADADLHGTWEAAKRRNNPDIIKHRLYARAMARYSHSHDTVLFIDAKMRNIPLPTAEESINATDNAFKQAKRYLYKFDKRPTHVKYTEAFRQLLDEKSDELAPLTKRRAALYIEASEYFAPGTLDKTTPTSCPAPKKIPHTTSRLTS